MRRPARLGAALLTAALLTVGVTVAAGPATADPAAPVLPTAGPSERVCPAATPGTVTCFAEVRTGVTPHAAGAAPAGYGPADLRSAYSIPATSSSGTTVATVVAYDHPTAAADLAAYREQYGLAPLASGQFRKVNQDGNTAPLPVYNAGWAGEAALDVQMITATCPACNVLLVEAKDTSLGNVAAAVRTAVRLGARFVSNSYGADDTGTASLASAYTGTGVSFFASTGDEGFSNGPPSFPATAPGVVAVGGTSLVRSASSRGWSETAWDGAGHGNSCSKVFAQPSFQAGLATGCATRAVADVSAVANPNTGVAVRFNGGWRVYGGTSAAAPIIAGIAAVAGQPGLTGAELYRNAGQFHDVTTGATGSCSPSALCTARTGWDGPTGLGTPNGLAGFQAPFTGCGGTPAAVASTAVTDAGRYVPLRPQRVLDTRDDGTTLGAGGTRTLDLGARLPAGTASAVVLNVTVTNPTAAGFVTAWPAGTTRPTASTLNTVPGLTRANEATVALGAVTAGGSPRAVSFYNLAGRSDLVVDLLGYYTVAGDPVAGLTYHPAATPSRAVDTRTSGGPLAASGARSVVCATLSQTAATPLTSIAAVAVTLTAVSPTAPGYLKAWNGDVATEPSVSSVNFLAGQVVPNATVVPVSCLDTACSRVTFAVANRISPSTQVLVDVVGVYAADPTAGLVLQSRSPQRVVDTRSNLGFGALGTAGTATVAVPGAVASGAVVANVTAVAPAASTYLTVFGGSQPPTSNLNPVPGEIVPAEVVSGVDGGGGLSVYNHTGRVDVLVDVSGVFVPPTSG